MKRWFKILEEPYLLFFPIGYVFGLWGVLLWLFFSLWGWASYPSVAHSYIMIGGFLTAFTTGFLMTAVPRFTGSFRAQWYEVVVSLVSLILLILFSSRSVLGASLVLILGNGNLVFFFLRRYFYRKVDLPKVFMFVPMSLLVSVLGHLFIVLEQMGFISSDYYILGRSLAFTAMVMGLILGVGSRLVPMITGLGISKLNHSGLLYLIILNFFLSFIIQIFWNVPVGLGLRTVSIFYVAFGLWNIHRRPLNPSKLSFGLWLSCWGIVIGSLGSFLMPSYLIHWSHIIYICGFGLMTLMIGSRVILSHGGFDLNKIGEHYQVIAVFICLLIAGVSRLLLFEFPDQTKEILLFSASFWIFGLVFWWIRVGSKLMHFFFHDIEAEG